jgi:hypothetical protein
MRLDRSSLALPIPWKVPPLDPSVPPPVVVGATGGSGTWVIAQVLQKAKAFAIVAVSVDRAGLAQRKWLNSAEALKPT